ncbi:LapA family protein [Candidatus Nitrosopelagicus sp.]|nr:LapA family protein [Candidatus Nitrosopelagicus sp.]
MGMFFIFVGAYSLYDAGISFQTTTTVIVIIASIGFILGGIYFLITYLKNRKILKRLD